MKRARLSRAALMRAVAAKTLVTLGLLATLGAAPAGPYSWWQTAIWVGGAIVALLIFIFILSRALPKGKDDGGGDNLL